ncbi:MAG: hypothetical protein H5T84_05880, partial [Thermoleophilia bacterium]|nr:hypothetical protein [Thermoleophilia bacterium]
YDTFTIRNFDTVPAQLPVSLAFRAGFQDVFGVRSLSRQLSGVLQPPRTDGERLYLRYEGRDGLVRTVTIWLWQKPDRWEGTTAFFDIALGPREEKQFALTISLAEEEPAALTRPPRRPLTNQQYLAAKQRAAAEEWRARQTKVRSSSLLLDNIMERSFRDLYLLRSFVDGEEYYAAGVPWFSTLFGRDSIIAALQTLAYDPAIARQTLRTLALYQGKNYD